MTGAEPRRDIPLAFLSDDARAWQAWKAEIRGWHATDHLGVFADTQQLIVLPIPLPFYETLERAREYLTPRVGGQDRRGGHAWAWQEPLVEFIAGVPRDACTCAECAECAEVTS